ncbi:MAG: phosphate ABC transporter, permease protein PstA, partial [Actinomycetota bacterium]
MSSLAFTDTPVSMPQPLAADQGHDAHQTQTVSTEAETIIPVRSVGAEVAQLPRPIGRWTRRDALTLLGVGCSSVATTMLIFGRLTSLSGSFGFVIVGFLVFLATYAVLTSITERRPTVVDKVMTVLLAAATAVAFFALVTVVVFTVAKGWSALHHLNFFTEDLSETLPNDPVEVGGILHAIVGTLIMMLLALIFTVPLGLSCAVFLNESRSRMATFVRTVVTAMTALPSVLAGLFIFALFILILGFERSGLAASVATSIMMLPIIIRSADVVLRLVPG